jgi:hypothetical protein
MRGEIKTVVGLIDVWDVNTFDKDLMARLRANAELVRDYIATDRDISIERREAPGLRTTLLSNPHAKSYRRFLESLGHDMEARAIRAWHYTRLTDSEVDVLRTAGIRLSTSEATRQRLDSQVAAGQISVEIGNALFEKSPLRDRQQSEARSGRFWMTSHPLDVEDGGVTLLLANWGGEVVYFWLQDVDLERIVAGIGSPRVIEVGVRLDATTQSYVAGESVVATFARSIGCRPDFGAFDLCAIRPLGPQAVLAVHTEGESAFDLIGKGYPVDFCALER